MSLDVRTPLMLVMLTMAVPAWGATEASRATSPSPVLPHCFVENLGQSDSEVRFTARVPGGAALFLDHGIRFVLTDGGGMTWTFRHGRADASPKARESLPGRYHYYLGNDPSNWVRNARSFSAITYRDIYPDIDVCFRFESSRLEYDIVLRPGADARAFGIEVDGAKAVRESDGSIVYRTANGTITQLAPHSFTEDSPGRCTSLPIGFELDDCQVMSIRGVWDNRGSRTVIDPALVFSSYLGGNGGELGRCSAFGADGSLVVGGLADSSDLATIGAFYTGAPAFGDAFVAKIAGDGTELEWCAVFGGTAANVTNAVQVAQDGRVYACGATEGYGFPVTTGALSSSVTGISDAFVVQLSSDGSSLVSSTFFGGTNGFDGAYGLALDGQDRVYIVGESDGPDLPVTPGAISGSLHGNYDGYLAILSGDCKNLIYSTYLGGPLGDRAEAVVLDPVGSIYVLGDVFGTYPVTPGAYDTTTTGSDMFITKLLPLGAGVQWATYLGGDQDFDDGGGLALTSNGRVVVAGFSDSFDFPTTPGSFDPSWDGGPSITLSELSADGSSLVYSGCVSGGQNEQSGGVCVDASGNAYVAAEVDVGLTTTPDAFDKTPNGTTDLTLTRISADGSKTLYATYIGGSGYEKMHDFFVGAGNNVAISANRRVAVVGQTFSLDYPVTPGAFDTSFSPQPPMFYDDAAITVFDFCAGTFTPSGVGCPGSFGTTPTLTGKGCPASGGNITLTFGNALGNAPALLLFGAGTGSLPLNPSCAVQIAPLFSIVLPFVLPSNGSLSLGSMLPNPVQNGDVRLQLLVADPGANGGVSASATLKVHVAD